MKSVLEEGMAQVVTAARAVDIEILDCFEEIHIADCSVIKLPAELASLWRGTGGAGEAGKAALTVDNGYKFAKLIRMGRDKAVPDLRN